MRLRQLYGRNVNACIRPVSYTHLKLLQDVEINSVSGLAITCSITLDLNGKTLSLIHILLIRHCSPTLAGIKTGNLFYCACPSRKDLTRDLCRLNKKLVPKGIRVLPLRACKGRALIYACLLYTSRCV